MLAANRALIETLADPTTAKRLEAIGARAPMAEVNTPEVFGELIVAENKRWVGVLRKLQ